MEASRARVLLDTPEMELQERVSVSKFSSALFFLLSLNVDMQKTHLLLCNIHQAVSIVITDIATGGGFPCWSNQTQYCQRLAAVGMFFRRRVARCEAAKVDLPLITRFGVISRV